MSFHRRDTSFKAKLLRFARTGGSNALGLQIFSVTVVMMVAALMLMSVSLSNLRDSRHESEVTEDTMLEITTVESRMLDFEGAQYGLAMSGAAVFQKRAAADDRELHDALDKLKRSLANEPEQSKKLNAVIPLIQKRNEIYRSFATPGHQSQTGDTPQANYAKAISDRARGTLWQILKSERHKRFSDHTEMIDEAAKSYWIAIAIVLLAMVSGGFCLLLPALAKQPGEGR